MAAIIVTDIFYTQQGIAVCVYIVTHSLSLSEAAVLVCKYWWRWPYTWDFDSALNSSRTKAIIPHGHIPASIPIKRSHECLILQTRLYVCLISNGIFYWLTKQNVLIINSKKIHCFPLSACMQILFPHGHSLLLSM